MSASSICCLPLITVGENGRARSKLTCSLEWLTREDADPVKDNKNEYIVVHKLVPRDLSVVFTTRVPLIYIHLGSSC
jgi:hypothetical protein